MRLRLGLKIWVAGRRTGKSFATANEVMPYMFEPGKRIWIVGPTYDLGEKEFRVIWDVIVKQLGLGAKKVKKAYNKDSGSMYLEFLEWGTRLEVRSADHPQNLVGEALDFVVLAEAAKIKDEVWKLYLRPALADKRGAAIISTTPQGHNWVMICGSWGRIRGSRIMSRGSVRLGRIRRCFRVGRTIRRFG